LTSQLKKILLIEPPFYRLFNEKFSLDRYPLSLGYLAGEIKKKSDWGVMVYNADFCKQSEMIKVSFLTGKGFDNYLECLKDISKKIWEEVRSVILDFSPDVVAISVKSQNFSSAAMVARIAKEINKEIKVIVGGPHPSMVGADVLKSPFFDISVKGEGEITIVELLKAIEQQSGLNSILGIVYREGDQIIENGSREFINKLDSLGFPHITAPEVLRDYQYYPITAFRNIFAARGCPFRCIFCGSHKIWSRKVRFRSVENVIAEIKSLQKIGLKSIHFDDDTFGIKKPHINSLCNAIISQCGGLKFSCEIHVRLVDDATISLMKKAGCYQIQLGIESGSDRVLNEINKNITIDQALKACRLIKKHGIELITFFMVGFPQETEESLRETILAMGRVNCDSLIYSIFTPYPGTEVFEICKREGLIRDDYDVSLYNHQSPANCFVKNIKPERFREMVKDVEKMIDRRNFFKRIRRRFSFDTLWKLQELGIMRTIQKGMGMLFGK